MKAFDSFYIYKASLVCFPKEKSCCSNTKSIGFYRSYDKLVDQIKKAGSDLVEAKWQYLVIERWLEGVWPNIEEGSERWFEFKDNEWKRCAQPEQAKGCVEWTA